MSDDRPSMMDRMNSIVARKAGDVSDDPGVQQWVFIGRIASLFCLWMVFIVPIALVISLRF